MAVLQGKGSEVSTVLQGPLDYMEQSLSEGNTPYLTGVQHQHPCLASARPIFQCQFSYPCTDRHTHSKKAGSGYILFQQVKNASCLFGSSAELN